MHKSTSRATQALNEIMATLLFKLRHVPDDEAEEVRALLEENEIETYETSAGNWKISMPAIWLTNDNQLDQARLLLGNYQQQRYQQAKQDYDNLQRQGESKTLWQNFLVNPLRVTISIGLITLVLYLSLQLFLSLQ